MTIIIKDPSALPISGGIPSGGHLLSVSGDMVERATAEQTWAFAESANNRTFATRAEFVSLNATAAVLPEGYVIHAGGVPYRREDSATVISDIPGWVPQGPITPQHFGAAASGSGDDATAIAAANSYAASLGRAVEIGGGTFAFAGALTFTAPVVFKAGGILKPSGTVTFNAGIEAGDWQIFDTSAGGNIAAGGRVAQVNALWFGMSQTADTATATANANAIQAALKTRRPVLLPPTAPNRATGWPVLSGVIIITDQDTAITGPRGAKTIINQYGSGNLFTIRSSYHTAEWLEVRGDRDATGALTGNLTTGFPWYLDTATQPIIQQITIRNCRTYNTWGIVADAKSGTAGNVPKQWFISDIEADLLRGPGIDIGDGNGSVTFDNVGAGRGDSARIITAIADAGGGNVQFTTSVAHGFTSGNPVGIAGTVNYNGASTIVATPTPWTFTIAAAYVAETPASATASSRISWLDYPFISLDRNNGSNFSNMNMVGTSEDAIVAGTLIGYPNQHGMVIANTVSSSFDGIYLDHCGGRAFDATDSYNLKATRMHVGYSGGNQIKLTGVTRSRLHVEWMRGIPVASGGAASIDGCLINSGCSDVVIHGGTAVSQTGHAFNIAGDRCCIQDWAFDSVTGDGLRYTSAASGVSSGLSFITAPASGVYARNLGANTRVLHVERETGTIADLCHVGALQGVGTGSRQFDTPVGVGVFTVATQPAAATHTGREIWVSDAPGGARRRVSDGSSWIDLMTASDIPTFTGSTPYATRAAAASATIDAGVQVLSLYHRGQLLFYKRDATGTALQTADGQWWSPAGIPTVDHWATPVVETDDAAAAIAAANNWVAANGGGDLLFNAVRYQVDTPLVLTAVQDVTWRGQGFTSSNSLRTTIYLNTGASDGLVLGDASTSLWNFKMFGLRIAHNPAMTGWSLRLLNLQQSRFEQIRVAGGYNGIRVENANNIHFEHVQIGGQTGAWGFYLVGEGGSGIDVVTFKNCGVSQTDGTETVTGWTLDGDVATVLFHDCRGVRLNRGLWTRNTTASPTAKTMFVYTYGLEFDFPLNACVRLDVGEYFSFYGSYFHGSDLANNVLIEGGVKEVHIFGGKVTSAVLRGVWIKGQRVSLTNVSVGTNGLSSYGTIDGIYIDSTADDVRIIGGRSNPGGSINSQRYGIGIHPDATKVTIVGVDLSGNVTGPINDTFTAGEVRISQCPGVEWQTVGAATYADDTAAAAAGVPIGGVYRTSAGALAWRQV